MNKAAKRRKHRRARKNSQRKSKEAAEEAQERAAARETPHGMPIPLTEVERQMAEDLEALVDTKREIALRAHIVRKERCRADELRRASTKPKTRVSRRSVALVALFFLVVGATCFALA